MCGGKKVEYKMCFSKLQANKENPSSPLHRLAAKTQIKLLELEDAAYNNGIYNGQFLSSCIMPLIYFTISPVRHHSPLLIIK